jgi:chaperone modulatory protein CbpM
MSRHDRTLAVEITDADGGVFTLREVCERGECHAEFVIKLVNHGILSPVEEHRFPLHWQFDVIALTRLQRALRLQQDLKLNLPGLAVSLDLLDEVRQMRKEVNRLHQRILQLSGE